MRLGFGLLRASLGKSNVVVAIALGWSLTTGVLAVAQSLSPNFLPAGAPLPGEVQSPQTARYASPSSSPVRSEIPISVNASGGGGESHYFQPGRGTVPPSTAQYAVSPETANANRYSPQLLNSATQQAYPLEQQQAAQRYAAMQQATTQHVEPQRSAPAVQQSLPPYQVRELEHQREYQRQAMRQTTGASEQFPVSRDLPQGPVVERQTTTSEATSLNTQPWNGKAPTGATVRVSSAGLTPSSVGDSRNLQSPQPAAFSSTAAQDPRYHQPARAAQQVARPDWPTTSSAQTAPSVAISDLRERVEAGRQAITSVPTFHPNPEPTSGPATQTSGEAAGPVNFPPQSIHSAETSEAPAGTAIQETSATETETVNVQPATEAALIAELMLQVQQRTKEVEAAAGMQEQDKVDTLAALKSASEWLSRAVQWEKKTAEYKLQAESVPQDIAKAKALLEQPAVALKPEYAADAGLVHLEQLLVEAEATLKQNSATFMEQEDQIKQRSERRAAIGKQLEQVELRIAELAQALKAGVVEGLVAELAQAQTLDLKSRIVASRVERVLLQAESLRHEAVTELLPLQRDLAQRTAKQQELLVTKWREEVADFRKRESERQASEARERVAAAHPALKALAERNAILAERRTELAGKIEIIHGDLEWINTTLKEIDLQYKGIMEKVKVVGLSSTVGMLLRKQRGELPNLAFHHDRLAEIELELPQVQFASIELEEERELISDLDAAVNQVVGELDGVADQFQPDELKRIVREFLETKKKYLDDLLNDNDAYQETLGELDIVTRKLTGKTNEFCNYIDKHVLWIRSAEPVAYKDFQHSVGAIAKISSPHTLVTLVAGLGQALQLHPILWLGAIVGFVVLRLTASRIRSRLAARLLDVRQVGIVACFAPVWASLGLTLFNAMMWPAFTWFVGWQLAALRSASEVIPALAQGLMTTSLLGIALEIVRQACMPAGLAENYLEWPAEQLQLVRQKLRWLMIVGLPAVFLIIVIEGLREGEWTDSAGRLIFIAGMGLLTLLSHGLLRPAASIWHRTDAVAGNLIHRLRHVWYFVSIAAPLGLAWLASTGYYYSARELAVRLKMSFWLLLAIVMATSLLTRMLLVVAQGISRHKRHNHAEKRPEELSASLANHDAEASGVISLPLTNSLELSAVAVQDTAATAIHEHEEDAIDLHNVRAQVTRLVQGVALLTFILVSWNIWAEVLPAFRVLDKVELWTTVRDVMENVTDPDGNVSVTVVRQPVPTTLTHLILALAIFQITLLGAKNLPGLLEIAVLNRLPIDRGGRYAVSVICRYALTVAGFMWGFRMLGLTWSSVQWLIAAMTVGLGFGLQEIFANFVSGMIILFERPMRVGDLVTIGGMTGTVSRVQIRATTITDADRRELIIPNKNFITGELINWTLSDTITRVVIPIGVAYGSDIALTQSTLLRIGESHPQVLKEPGPSAMFVKFGDSTLNFELSLFLGSRDNHSQVLHELNTAIDREFRAAKIEIAFPHQELTIRSNSPLMPFLNQPAADSEQLSAATLPRAA